MPLVVSIARPQGVNAAGWHRPVLPCARATPPCRDNKPPQILPAPCYSDARRFQNAQGVNHSLRELYTLLAEDRISPRRASVLAYISSLLLRTLPAIDNDPYPLAGIVPPPQIDSARALEEEEEGNEEGEDEEEHDTEPLQTNDDPLQPDSEDALKNSKPN